MKLDRRLFATALLACTLAVAQTPATIDAAVRRQVIDNTVRAMQERHAFPEIAMQVEDALRVAQVRALAPLAEEAGDPRLRQAMQARIVELSKPL